MQLHHQCHGAGFPLIILHGLLGSSDNWQGISRKLADTRRVCAVDLRNHGRSPHDEKFGYEVMSQDLLEFMTGQEMGRANILGHSMGGKAAMHFALHHPEKVEKLVVVDMAPRAYKGSHQPIFEALFSLDLGGFRERGEIDRALAARIPESAVRQFLLKNVTRDEHGNFRWKPNLPAIWRNYGEVSKGIDNGGKFEGPTLFIRGGRSDYLSDEDGTTIARLFPSAKIVAIPEAGHWVHADAPEKFAEIVGDFLG